MRLVTAIAIFAFAAQSVAVPAAAQELGPEALVKKVTTEVLDAIQKDKELQAGDRHKALKLAEEKVLPHIDFRESTRLAAGQAWKQANPQQQERLVAEFRSMLVRTYSNAIDAYRGQTMKVMPVRMKPGDTEATVRNQYVSLGNRPVAVDYAMRKTPEGWKIYDIVVEGMSLVITYRAEFNAVVRQSGIDGLIKRLAEKNTPPKLSGGAGT